jgi:hypothetical protein
MPDVVEVFGDGASQIEVITDDENVVEVVVPGPAGTSSGGGGTWGSITGTLSDQTDLQTALNAKQALDADLTAIAGLAGTSGFLTKTAANTWSLDTSTYLTSLGIGSSTQAWDADLDAIAALAGTSGFLKKTAADTWTLDTSTYLTSVTPGGSTTQIQYNNAGALDGASGITTTGTEFTIASGTKTASTPVLNMSQTWNSGAVTFTAIKLNVTDTASNASSLLADLQVGGSTVVSVLKSGTFQTYINSTFSGFYITRTGEANAKIGLRVDSSYAPQLAFGAGGANILDIGICRTGSQTLAVCTNPGGANANGRLDLATIGVGTDALITRKAAASLRLGAADAAAPVAQTLGVQSVVAGTSNTAGANFTIAGSQGTGTGAGGDIIFQVAPLGSSGSSQNALAQGARVYANKTMVVGAAFTVATLPAAGTQGRRAWVTDATAPTFLGALTGGGAVVCPVFDNGTAWVSG